MSQSSVRNFWLVLLATLFVLFIGVSLIVSTTHKEAMRFSNGEELLYRLVTGTHVLERSDDANTFVVSYETSTFSTQSFSLEKFADHNNNRQNNNNMQAPMEAMGDRSGTGITLFQDDTVTTATLYSNLSASYVTLSELSRRVNYSCPSLSAGVGVGMACTVVGLLLAVWMVGNYVASWNKLYGAIISYAGVVILPCLMMLALLGAEGALHWHCEQFERGERLGMTVNFQAELFSTLSSLPSHTPDAVIDEMRLFVNAVNRLQHDSHDSGFDSRVNSHYIGGGFHRAMSLVRAGQLTVVAGKPLPAHVSKLLLSMAASQAKYHIVDSPSFTGIVAKSYHRESGLWLVLTEEFPPSPSSLSHEHIKGGMVVGLIGAAALSIIGVLVMPLPSLGVTNGQRLGMAPTSDVSSVWPLSKALCFFIMVFAVGVSVISNLSLTNHVSRYYDTARVSLGPLLSAYTDLQTISLNTAMIVANASLGQDWDARYETYPSHLVNDTARIALIAEQQTIRAITSDYIDRYGPLGVYQAGYGTSYPPFAETTAARTFLASLTSPSDVSRTIMFIDRAEFAFLVLLLTQDMRYEDEMLRWLEAFTNAPIGTSRARAILVSAITSITLPVRTAISQVSLTDARSQIVLLSSSGAIPNNTHSIYLEMLSAAADPVTMARTRIRSELGAPSIELYHYFRQVTDAVAVSVIIAVGLVAMFDSWYTPSFLARKRSGGVPMTIFLIFLAILIAVAATLGSSAALSADVSDMTAATDEARRLFELVPRSLRLLDTAARSLAEWLLVLQTPTALSLNHAMSIDSMLRFVLQNFVDAIPDASDPRTQYILGLTSDLCDTLNNLFAVVARDYRDPTLPLADASAAMDSLYVLANASLFQDGSDLRGGVGTAGDIGGSSSTAYCSCISDRQVETNTATVLEMARSVILRSASLWALPTALRCCAEEAERINQLYRRAIVYMQVEAVDEGALTTTDMATLTMRATRLLQRMQRTIAAFQNSITAPRKFQTRNWAIGFWLPIAFSWVVAVVGGIVLKFTGAELNAATK